MSLDTALLVLLMEVSLMTNALLMELAHQDTTAMSSSSVFQETQLPQTETANHLLSVMLITTAMSSDSAFQVPPFKTVESQTTNAMPPENAHQATTAMSSSSVFQEMLQPPLPMDNANHLLSVMLIIIAMNSDTAFQELPPRTELSPTTNAMPPENAHQATTAMSSSSVFQVMRPPCPARKTTSQLAASANPPLSVILTTTAMSLDSASQALPPLSRDPSARLTLTAP